MGVGSVLIALLITLLSILVFYVKNKYFVVLPGEEGLDFRSFVFAKASVLVLPAHSSLQSEELTVRQSRKTYNTFLNIFQLWDHFRDPSLQLVPFDEVRIPVPQSYPNDAMTSIAARVYNFDRDEDSPLKPVLVWFHGGGWSKGSMASDHSQCLKLSQALGMIVVNVDYRMAPEYRFPVAPKDAYSSLQWTIENIGRYGGDASRIVLGGESAGGNLAAAATSLYLDLHPDQSPSPLIGLYLVYAALDVAVASDGPGVEFANTNGLLTLAGTARSRYLYSGSTDLSIRKNYLFAPSLSPHSLLSRYPPTVFVTAKYDVLAHESVEFAEKLRQFAIPVTLLEYTSTVHGFFGRELISPAGPLALRESAHALIRLLNL